jgi:outer membrane protein assembly factor BamB
MAEPTTLVCLSGDGEILWKRTSTYMDTVTDPAERKRIEQDAETHRELQAKLRPLEKQLQGIRKSIRKARKNPELRKDPNELHRVVNDLEKQRPPLWEKIKPIQEKMKGLKVFQMPRTHGGTGYSSPTPLSDGKHVWVLLGTGVAACYDMRGDRKWCRIVEIPNRGWGHSASPILVDGKLICHVRDVWALESTNGKTQWRGKARNAFGTPLSIEVANRPIVVSAGGVAFDAADGNVVASKLPKLSYNSPVAHENVVYFIENGGRAIRFAADADGRVKAEELWRTKPKRDRYYASPLYHEGLLYAVTQRGVFSVIDAASGSVVCEQTLELGKGKVYPSLTLAGAKILSLSEGGGAVVLQPGRTFRKLTSASLGKGRSTPVFGPDGRMYRRGQKYLYCYD